MPALEVRGLEKSFGSVHAVRDASFTVHAGSALALMGENGAGKSTAAAIISGLVHPEAGEVLVQGRQVPLGAPRAAYEAGIRAVPQEVVLCRNLSVAENICLGHFPRSRLGTLKSRAMREIARQRLATLGLGHLDVNRRAESLTVAECAFVQIARVITEDAAVLILDEPTAPMSNGEADTLLTLLGSLTKRGIGVLFVSHRLDEVFRVCDSVVVMRDGRVVAQARDGSISRDELVAVMVGGRPLATAGAKASRPQASPALSARGLISEQLRGVDLDVHAGEIVGVYGIPGSGREQLGPVLVGRTRREGEIRVGGSSLRARSVRAAIAAGIGYVPAERRTEALMLDASVQRNLTVAMTRRLSRRGILTTSAERAVTKRWMDTLHIAGTPGSPVRTLSGGSQQKVVLARWLAADCPVLVLVEPTRGVDIATKAEIYRLLHSLAADGKAVLVISSDIEEVSVVADRVLVLRAGRVAASLPRSTQETIARHAHSGLAPAPDLLGDHASA